MSRFVNLELDGEPEGQGEASRALVKDEAHYCAAARAAFQNGQFEPALRLYAKVLEFNPQNAAAWAGQVRMLTELEDYQEAGLWADKGLERFPREAELLAAKAVALGRSGDGQGALAFSDAAIEEQGETPYVWLARGDILLARKERQADGCLEKALALAPGDWFVAWLAGRIRFYHRQFALALKLMEQAREWNAGHFLLWLEVGRCQQALGLVGAARHSLSQARQLNPRCQEAGLALAQLAGAGLAERVRGWWGRLFPP